MVRFNVTMEFFYKSKTTTVYLYKLYTIITICTKYKTYRQGTDLLLLENDFPHLVMLKGPLVYSRAYLTRVCCHKIQHVEQEHLLIHIPNNIE